jgi:hypothetical protein
MALLIAYRYDNAMDRDPPKMMAGVPRRRPADTSTSLKGIWNLNIFNATVLISVIKGMVYLPKIFGQEVKVPSMTLVAFLGLRTYVQSVR